MSKIIVDREKCKGYGVCVSICPQIFQLDKDGKAEVISQDYESQEYKRAIDSCPTQAISLEK